MRRKRKSAVFKKIVSFLLVFMLAIGSLSMPAYAKGDLDPKYGMTSPEWDALMPDEQQARKAYWKTLTEEEQFRLNTEARDREAERRRLENERIKKEREDQERLRQEELEKARQEADEKARLAAEEKARQAEEAGNLTLNADQADPVAALGFSTDQPERYTPSGQLVDRKQSPFGVNKVTKFGVNQLLLNANAQSILYKAGYPPGTVWRSTAQNVIGAISDNGTPTADLINAGERVSVAADTDGDGKDEVVTVFYNKSTGKIGVSFTQYVDYTDERRREITRKQVTKTYTQVGTDRDMFFQNGAPGVLDKLRSTYAVSGDFDHDGKDEVAIGRGDTIVLCRVTAASLTVLSSLKLNSQSEDFRTMVQGGVGAFGSSLKTLTVNSMLAEDLDDDGFRELFVTAGREFVSKSGDDTDEDINDYERGTRSYLMIFRNTTDITKLKEPAVELSANVGENAVYIDNPGMDVGDIFGDGERELVIGGKLFGRKDDNNVGLTTLHYDPETDSYQTGLSDNRIYTFVTNDFKAVQGKLGVKCVNFDPAAFRDYVVLGGFIYKYNPENDVFDKQTVNNVNTSGLKVNGEAKSKNNLTNTNVSKDKTYILDMLADNFNEQTLEKIGVDTSEQLVVLHHNEWYDSRRIYVTTVGMTNGALYAYMEQRTNSKDNLYFYSICAPDIYDRGLQMEFIPGDSEFIFSDPMVVAVLGATPYYKELENEYEGLGNAKTLFGTEKSKTSSQSHGLSVAASFICGYEFSVNLFYGNITKAAWELEVSNEFTATFEKYSSVTKQILYENYYSQNAVVVTAIPYDCYYFKVTNTQTGASENTKIMVPFPPVTRIMSFPAYQKAASGISSIPDVSSVFNQTIGDPRTYPQNRTNLSNIKDAQVLLGMSGDDYGNFVGVGIGNNVTEQGIDITQGTSRTLENKLEVKFTMTGGGGGVYVGGSAALGYTYSSTKSSEETTMYSGSVAGLPEDREAYSYKWCLTAYPYDLTVGSGKQRCMVVGYLCQPVGANYPSAPVKNFRVDSRSAMGVTLKWDAPVTANVQTTGLPSGYTLYRADSADGEYIWLANISGRTNATYNDTTATENDAYYCRLTAVNTRESTPVTLEIPRIKLKSMAPKALPTLSYEDGEVLDLSQLAVTLTYENGNTKDVAFGDFGDGFLTSVQDGATLNLSQAGSKLTVTYVPDGVTMDVGTLDISAVVAYDIGLTAVFTVGADTNAARLEAGKGVGASASLENNTATAQPVLVILALYSGKGAMVASSTKTVTVAASGTSSVSFTDAFTVPAQASGYTAKLFVWDGTSVTDTKQVPKSNVILLP